MSTSKRPNILYLLADQWRGAATGYAGDPNARTPNLDRLARQSLNLRNAVSVCPVCTPHRASLLTGRYPTSTGMFLNDAAFPVSETGLGEALKAAGYATGYIGKWHLDGHGRDGYIPPERRHGWDYWKVAECDHRYNQSHYYTGESPQKCHWEGYDAYAQTKDAQEFLRVRSRVEEPFALMVSFGPPHEPLDQVPPEYQKLYETQAIELPPNVPEEQRQPALTAARGYYAHIAALDRCVGQLLQTLEETGLAENTILVFTSDHGVLMGSHGGGPIMKQAPWDEAARVPFLLRYPAAGINNERVLQMPLTTPDILPTLLSLAGVAIPARVEGQDLSRIVRGQQPAADRAALYMGVSPFGRWPDVRPYRAIRTSQYTYARSLQGPWLLFDDVKDPYQMDNLVGRPEFAGLLQELDMRLQAELKRIGDDFRSDVQSQAEWGYEVQQGRSIPYTPGSAVQSPRRRTH